MPTPLSQIYGQGIEFKAILVEEVVQARNTLLFHFACPLCGKLDFAGDPVIFCRNCARDLTPNYLVLNPARKKILRCIVGCDEKLLKVTKRTIRTLLETQNHECAYCDRKLVDYTVDHVRPPPAGGDNSLANLAIVCPDCRKITDGKVFSNFSQKKLFVYAAMQAKQRKAFAKIEAEKNP